MHGYNFTERVRKVLALARQESAALGHEYVGTEHILLGLVHEGEGLAMTALEKLGTTGDEIRAQVVDLVRPGSTGAPSGPDLPYTSRAKKVLELAMSEAREMQHNYVGTEHILLGLIHEGKGIAAQVLIDLGISLDAARTVILGILGDVATDSPPEAPIVFVRRPRRPVESDGPGSPLPDALEKIIADSLQIAKSRGRAQPEIADLLSAIIFSSREVSAAFATREIEVSGLIAEIQRLTDAP